MTNIDKEIAEHMQTQEDIAQINQDMKDGNMPDTSCERRLVMQFISAKNGQRSDAFVVTLDQLREILESTEEPVPHDDFLLVVADLTGEDVTIPKAPIITVETFLSMYSTENLNEVAENA